MKSIVKRFLKYVSFDTTSSEESTSTPSTSKQLKLAKYLEKELLSIGVNKVIYQEDTGIVYGFINANCKGKDKIGLIAHMDTSPEASDKDVKPNIIEKYDGKDIILNEKENIVLSTKDFPNIKKHKGKSIITTDGTTLLGADDKAGIAIIMESIERIIKDKDYKHGRICIAFTPDEEVGRGTENFDIKLFDADYAYTVDGGDINYIEDETFNAASAVVKIHGRSVHPGSAKGKMINASLLAMEFDRLLPENELPELTEGRVGFHYLAGIKSECEEGMAYYIIRNHDSKILNRQKNDFIKAMNIMNKKYKRNVIEVAIKDQYCNMKEYVEKCPKCLRKVEEAYKALNKEYAYVPVRGGTDGASLSARGLPTPNLGTGGDNYHGRFEYLVIDDMEFMVEVLLKILN